MRESCYTTTSPPIQIATHITSYLITCVNKGPSMWKAPCTARNICLRACLSLHWVSLPRACGKFFVTAFPADYPLAVAAFHSGWLARFRCGLRSLADWLANPAAGGPTMGNAHCGASGCHSDWREGIRLILTGFQRFVQAGFKTLFWKVSYRHITHQGIYINSRWVKGTHHRQYTQQNWYQERRFDRFKLEWKMTNPLIDWNISNDWATKRL